MENTKNAERLQKTERKSDLRFVHTLLITPDLLKIFMESSLIEKTLYFEAVVGLINCNQL
jgi:hypothetical protein